jgi:hypothetical protein
MEHGLPRCSSSQRALIALALSALAGCQADKPSLTDAHGPLDGKCSGPYADQLLDSFPTTLANATSVLGAPDNNSVLLAANDVVTVGFIGLEAVTNAPGPDIRIHATVPPGAMALVRVAGPDQMFVYTGTMQTGTTDFDLGVSMLMSIVYVRVIDVSGAAISIDAFEAVHDVCH